MILILSSVLVQEAVFPMNLMMEMRSLRKTKALQRLAPNQSLRCHLILLHSTMRYMSQTHPRPIFTLVVDLALQLRRVMSYRTAHLTEKTRSFNL